MAVKINGTKLKKCNINGVKCKRINVNGVKVWLSETNFVTNGNIDSSVCSASSLRMSAYTDYDHGAVGNMNIKLDLTDVDSLTISYNSSVSGGGCTCQHWFDHQTIGYRWDAQPSVDYDSGKTSGAWWHSRNESSTLVFDTSGMTGWHTLYFTCRASWNLGSVGFTVTNIKGE